MRFLKIYINIGIFFCLVGLSVGFYIWYTIQKLDEQLQVTPEQKQEVSAPIENSSLETLEKNDAIEDVKATSSKPRDTEPMVIETSSLSDAQRKILSVFGQNSATFVVTENMITCGKSAVSESRFEEIINGGAPTPLESLRLLPCFKSPGG